MSDVSMGWRDILRMLGEPMFSIAQTPFSPARLLATLSVFLLALWLSGMAERALRRLAMRRSGQMTLDSGYALGRITRYALVGTGAVLALEIAGLSFGSLTVLGGALGLGVGLGLQPLLVNFVSGVVLLLDRSLKVGDFVDLQSGVRGRVVEIAMRYTRVSTNDSVDVLVPNSEFVNGRVTNWTFDDTRRRIHVPFAVAYGSDKSVVRAAAIAAASCIEGVLLDDTQRSPDAWLVAFGDSSLNFELVAWVDRSLSSAPAQTQARLLWSLEEELRLRGIVLPFPQRDLHIQSGPLKVELSNRSE